MNLCEFCEHYHHQGCESTERGALGSAACQCRCRPASWRHAGEVTSR